ncbi:hormogonium polysaccharide biosynthesis glycosyltransferase HpsE [Symplocastrum sp. BBK-W-15]|uniref:Hormogonium polysaccharide biosynthesis glycosyltransferase HpsE n=2 Tax=Limnofasciculus TaxID=3064905 RepID=A0AAE3GW18_9CYAN|nr:hormogonium polysaccharide biosynthesis glycosyltransferase HpsE [Limnofasciculus baicalensis BBK-W-15]
MMVDFSVAIRTYNGEQRLPEVLDRLKTQVGVDNISWEIVIIDNNSTDNTAKIIEQYQSDWCNSYPLKYYFEPKQGASFARKRAIQEAQGFLIGFLDDDNVPTANWVASAYAFGKLHPQAGAYGSRIHGDFEVEPPQNFERIAHFLPIIEREELICFNSHPDGRLGLFPPGAGLVIRKEAWLENVPDSLILQGPIGDSLAAKGEDIETLSYIKKAGWEIWFNPEMRIYHRIPKSRFERDYLLRFFRGIGLSRYWTRMLKHKSWERPFMIPVYMANDCRKLILHSFQKGNEIATDVVAASEREFLLYSFLSPFYFWINWMGRKK